MSALERRSRLAEHLEQFLLAERHGTRKGAEILFPCPAHSDEHPSARFNPAKGAWYCDACRAGGGIKDLAGRLGHQIPKRARQDSATKRSHKVAAAYNYTDADGTLLFQVVREDPKGFRQRRPDGKGGWIWNMDGVKRVPYRLPELLAADPRMTVYIPEGEKDADTVAALGLIATTNPGGGGKWKDEFSEYLRGRPVVILPDNDELGRRHAQDVARSVQGLASSVRVLALPGLREKGDVSDWIKGGGTAQDLAREAAEIEGWSPPPVLSTAVLLDALVALIRRFVSMTLAQAGAWALWVLHTHALDAAEQTPYISITSPEKRSGKTRVLEVSEQVVARPWFTGRTSAAALVRKIDAIRPTLLLDESDAAFNGEKDYAETLRGILNTGHRVNGRASVCVGVGASLEVRDFSTFCPKAIAGIGKLPDTVADRAIPIRLRRRAPDETVKEFREKKVRVETASLRGQLEAWAGVNIKNLATDPAVPDALTDRAKDVAEPLIAIADLAGGDWPTRARLALVELCGGDSPDNDSLGVRLLRDCRAVFEVRPYADRLASTDLLKALLDLEESPWSELHKGRPLTVRGLARLLNPYDVTPGSVRLPDGTTPKGYYRAAFADAWSRYVRPSPVRNATSPQADNGAGFLDSSKRHTGNLAANEKREIGNADGLCGGVVDRGPSRKQGGREEADEEAALL